MTDISIADDQHGEILRLAQFYQREATKCRRSKAFHCRLRNGWFRVGVSAPCSRRLLIDTRRIGMVRDSPIASILPTTYA
jgi:hypothetical protein